MSDPILNIDSLCVTHHGLQGKTEILRGISMHVNPSERVALVGESGSGKSVTARAALGLLGHLRGMEQTGTVEVVGVDLSTIGEQAQRALRGTQLSMIFQDPTASLNPFFRISIQFHEVLQRTLPQISLAAARLRAAELLDEVSIKAPERVLDSYPFQLSGGMNQRVMIAMALSNEPGLLLADEPGTALDVTVQAQTLALMSRLVDELGTAMLFISHSLGAVREFADRVYVIHRGRIVEEGPTAALFANPLHPYTRDLLAAVPRITGEGLPELREAGDYDAPAVSHPRIST